MTGWYRLRSVTNAVLNGHVNTSDVANIAHRIHAKNDKVSNLAHLNRTHVIFTPNRLATPLIVAA